MNFKRIYQHLVTGDVSVKRAFPARSIENIEQAIRAAETTHGGQIRFAVEASLEFAALRANQTAGERAIEIFSQLRVWDTELNNGVLIYLLLADHDVEIVADRGIHAKVGNAAWEEICHDMEAEFRAGKFEQGVIAGIHRVSQLLARHYPFAGEKINELADKPALL